VRLERKLAQWIAAGLISSDQAAGVRRFEESQRLGAKWVVWGLASVGGLAVVAGIISLIAANWEEIPEQLKLGGGLTLLLALALSAREVGERGDGWIRDLLLLLHQGMILAMIGLVAQVYHLSGHPWRPFALAFVLALPPVLAGRRSLLADVAIYFALQSLWFFLEEGRVLKRLLESFHIALVSVAIGVVFLVCAGPLARKPGGEAPAAALRRWAVGLLVLPVIAAAFFWSSEHGPWREWAQPQASWIANHWPLLLFVGALIGGFARARRQLDVAAAGTVLVGTL
jgi:uncharacterized membrane protein